MTRWTSSLQKTFQRKWKKKTNRKLSGCGGLHCASKNASILTCNDFQIHQLILITFGSQYFQILKYLLQTIFYLTILTCAHCLKSRTSGDGVPDDNLPQYSVWEKLLVPYWRWYTVKTVSQFRSFSVAVPFVWNNLPRHLWNDDISREQFARDLKTVLFARAYLSEAPLSTSV